MNPFRIMPHRGTDKSFKIAGPIELRVDYDDVDQAEQDILSRHVAGVLNDHWADPEYTGFREQLARLQEGRSKTP